MRNLNQNPDKSLSGGTQNISGEISSLRSSAGPKGPFSRGIVYEVLGDVSIRTEEELEELGGDIGGDSLDALKRAPRNSVIVSITEGTGSKIAATKILCYPFFPPHIALPVKPGEEVWILNPSPRGRTSYQFWMSRVHEPDDVDDVNYTHSMRRHDLYVDKYTATQLSEEQGQDSGRHTGKKEPGEIPGPPHFFDRPPDAEPTATTAISNTELQANPEKLRLPVSEAPTGFDELIGSSESYKYFTPEPVPRFSKRPGDLVFMGSNNSLICLGQDRGWNQQERPDGATNSNSSTEPISFSGTIDIVAGRGVFTEENVADPNTEPVGTQPRVIKNTRDNLEVDKNSATYTKDSVRSGVESNRKDRPVEGDPDFLSDASRIYVSMKTNPDINLGLDSGVIHTAFEGTLEDAQEMPSVVIKSNEVRVVSRQEGSIRFVKEGDSSSDQATIYLLPEGIVQLSGDKVYIGRSGEGSGPATGGSEPYIKYSEFKKLLESVIADITSFCNTLNTHTTPGFGAPSPQINAAATNLISALQQRQAEIPNVMSSRIFGE